jgi:peptidoglycan/xylan/chitin deacetylase (PgdA/CDA1 family)
MSATGFWPQGNQCAVAITVNYDGESVERRTIPERPLWGRDSYGRYPAKIGTRRLLDCFARAGVRATFFIPAWDAYHEPSAMRQIAAAGHEVAGHGDVHEDFSSLATDEQRAALERSEGLFRRKFGAPPAGWRAPDGLMTQETRPLLIERGYRYDSSFCDDDLPYLTADAQGRRMVELPVHASASDRPYYLQRRTPAHVSAAWREEFSAVYQAGGLFVLTLHPRSDYGSGRAVRIPAIEALLQTIRDTPRVWLATCGEIADWTMQALGGSAPFLA